MLGLPIPIISAFHSNLKSLLAQNLSQQFLDVFVDSAETTVLGELFHIATILLLKKCLQWL